MNNRVFVAADLHLGHKKVVEMDGRPPYASVEEHDKELIDNWNETVKSKDTVWILGDVLFGRESFKKLAKLNGRKKLVMGNHDHYDTLSYLEHFTQVFGSVKLQQFILTHIPVHPCQLKRFRGNIHGHLHHKVIDDDRYINVSMEQIGMRPKLFDTVIHEFNLNNMDKGYNG